MARVLLVKPCSAKYSFIGVSVNSDLETICSVLDYREYSVNTSVINGPELQSVVSSADVLLVPVSSNTECIDLASEVAAYAAASDVLVYGLVGYQGDTAKATDARWRSLLHGVVAHGAEQYRCLCAMVTHVSMGGLRHTPRGDNMVAEVRAQGARATRPQSKTLISKMRRRCQSQRSSAC